MASAVKVPGFLLESWLAQRLLSQKSVTHLCDNGFGSDAALLGMTEEIISFLELPPQEKISLQELLQKERNRPGSTVEQKKDNSTCNTSHAVPEPLNSTLSSESPLGRSKSDTSITVRDLGAALQLIDAPQPIPSNFLEPCHAQAEEPQACALQSPNMMLDWGLVNKITRDTKEILLCNSITTVEELEKCLDTVTNFGISEMQAKCLRLLVDLQRTGKDQADSVDSTACAEETCPVQCAPSMCFTIDREGQSFESCTVCGRENGKAFHCPVCQMQMPRSTDHDMCDLCLVLDLSRQDSSLNEAKEPKVWDNPERLNAEAGAGEDAQPKWWSTIAVIGKGVVFFLLDVLAKSEAAKEAIFTKLASFSENRHYLKLLTFGRDLLSLVPSVRAIREECVQGSLSVDEGRDRLVEIYCSFLRLGMVIGADFIPIPWLRAVVGLVGTFGASYLARLLANLTLSK